MNAAVAHAAFLMTVSAARMYWLLHHAQHARDINIHNVAVLQMQCMYRPVIPSFSFCIFHTEISTVLESRACI